MNSKKKIAVIYSRAALADSEAIKSQESACREVATSEGYTILESLVDNGKSGGNLDRPGMQKLIELVEAKKIHAVFTLNSDRLSRSIMDYLFLRKLLKNNRVLLRFASQQVSDDAKDSELDAVRKIFSKYLRTANTVKEERKNLANQKRITNLNE